jgi:hypothetical protein
MTHDAIDDAKAAAGLGDFEFAVTVLRPLAEAGNRDAQYQLGLLAMTECDLRFYRRSGRSGRSRGNSNQKYRFSTVPMAYTCGLWSPPVSCW